MLLGLLGLVLVVSLVGVAVDWLLGTRPGHERLAAIKASPHYRDGVFVNFEPAAGFDFSWAGLERQFFGQEQRVPPSTPPVSPLDAATLQDPTRPGLRTTWFGHASVLIEIDGHRIMTDPVLSRRTSPFQFLGPARFHAPPVALAQLSGIDAVVISHSHYDHLDEATVKKLAAHGTKFFLPLGIGTILEKWGVPANQITELDWWQKASIGRLSVTATPARHYSGRGLFDYGVTQWASWSINGPEHSVFYSGDTGYSAQFKEIGRQLGPFDVTLIKVGAYGPGQGWIDIHMPPEASVQVHLDVQGKRMLPVHWGTFNLALHAWDEPIERTLAAAKAKHVNVLTPKPGESVSAAQAHSNLAWWREVR